MSEEFDANQAEEMAAYVNWSVSLERLYNRIKEGIKQEAEKGEYGFRVDLTGHKNGEAETLKRRLREEGFWVDNPPLADVMFIQW